MGAESIIKDSPEFTKSRFRQLLQVGLMEGIHETYTSKPKIRRFEQEEELDYLRTPYTIEEIILIRKKIDSFILTSQELASHQSITLLNELYTKVPFKMALFSLIRSKPIAAVKVIGLSIMTLSLGGFVLNIVFREPLISPFLVLYFFYSGLLMTGMAILHRMQIRKQRNTI
jgi:hypothetical protein